jgi:hypothetical protein
MGFLTIVLELMATFAAATLLAFAIQRLNLRRKKVLLLPNGIVLKLRGANAMYRSRVIAKTAGGWSVAAPLQRDSHVPVRVREELTIEATTKGGVITFRTHVLSRDSGSHTLEIEMPDDWFLTERRQETRLTGLSALSISVEGRPGCLVDVSRQGARLLTNGHVARGERVNLHLPNGLGYFAGWILDAQPASFRHEPATEVRLRFEEPFDLSGLSALSRK